MDVLLNSSDVASKDSSRIVEDFVEENYFLLQLTPWLLVASLAFGDRLRKHLCKLCPFLQETLLDLRNRINLLLVGIVEAAVIPAGILVVKNRKPALWFPQFRNELQIRADLWKWAQSVSPHFLQILKNDVLQLDQVVSHQIFKRFVIGGLNSSFIKVADVFPKIVIQTLALLSLRLKDTEGGDGRLNFRFYLHWRGSCLSFFGFALALFLDGLVLPEVPRWQSVLLVFGILRCRCRLFCQVGFKGNWLHAQTPKLLWNDNYPVSKSCL